MKDLCHFFIWILTRKQGMDVAVRDSGQRRVVNLAALNSVSTAARTVKATGALASQLFSVAGPNACSSQMFQSQHQSAPRQQFNRSSSVLCQLASSGCSEAGRGASSCGQTQRSSLMQMESQRSSGGNRIGQPPSALITNSKPLAAPFRGLEQRSSSSMLAPDASSVTSSFRVLTQQDPTYPASGNGSDASLEGTIVEIARHVELLAGSMDAAVATLSQVQNVTVQRRTQDVEQRCVVWERMSIVAASIATAAAQLEVSLAKKRKRREAKKHKKESSKAAGAGAIKNNPAPAILMSPTRSDGMTQRPAPHGGRPSSALFAHSLSFRPPPASPICIDEPRSASSSNLWPPTGRNNKAASMWRGCETATIRAASSLRASSTQKCGVGVTPKFTHVLNSRVEELRDGSDTEDDESSVGAAFSLFQ